MIPIKTFNNKDFISYVVNLPSLGMIIDYCYNIDPVSGDYLYPSEVYFYQRERDPSVILTFIKDPSEINFSEQAFSNYSKFTGGILIFPEEIDSIYLKENYNYLSLRNFSNTSARIFLQIKYRRIKLT